MSESGLSKIPYWDGKAESFGVYVSKIEAYAKIVGVGGGGVRSSFDEKFSHLVGV